MNFSKSKKKIKTKENDKSKNNLLNNNYDLTIDYRKILVNNNKNGSMSIIGVEKTKNY